MKLFISGSKEKPSDINRDLVKAVRNLIGPIVFFRLVAAVDKLPRTRSGKVLRKTIADLAKSKFVKVSGIYIYLNIKLYIDI